MFRQLDAKPREFRDFPAEDVLYNDFERVAPCASLDLIERLLVYGADDAALTGSGSVVFGRFPDRASAEWALAKIAHDASWFCLSST
jgi:4-diphosphocytidyl-2-C-methyl-D-erythritol kinase